MDERSINIISILHDTGYLDESITESVIKDDAKTISTKEIIEYLVNEELLTYDLIGQAMAEFYEVEYADLNSRQPDRELVKTLPSDIRNKYRVIPFEKRDGTLALTTDNPDALISSLSDSYLTNRFVEIDHEPKSVMAKMRNTFDSILRNNKDDGQPNFTLADFLEHNYPDLLFKISYSLSKDIDNVLLKTKQSLKKRVKNIINESGDEAAADLVEEILSDALGYRTSDVHFDITQDSAKIRFRIDGILHTMGEIDLKLYNNLLNRLKVKAGLRIDEHQEPQDGAIRFKQNGQDIDLRLSIIPTMNGEKAEIRILSSYLQKLTLDELGLEPEDAALVRRQIKEPYGMILVTGPTGSGKTTTLYAAIKMLNKPETNITTIEDPVEYRIEGINQIQVNPEADLTFHSGLRSIMRQDPDVILVGEIRDEETASIAVNAALTGHLLLSTFHANDAATAIPRMIDMDIEEYLLASTLNMIVAQRLVRRLCLDCAYSEEVSFKELSDKIDNPQKLFSQYNPNLSKSKKIRLYNAKGCDTCNGLGFKGRTAVYEFLEITPEMEELIATRPTSKEVFDLARKQGFKTMFEDGIAKVSQGVTTVDELLRVVQQTHEEK